ncbi:rhodanese-like domain-containing protein [Methylovirgula sp. HY1]|uniref:rhodanese-like domain-containing protein n=1 Tax=Methylovirgula sp. HY1 TaxID=2822761 RepID=UPI001C5B569F|nr:Thiosulfate sulfurtransferase GlpE [Methylovirgula sp. HY1]
MNAPIPPKANAADVILAYHKRTKHSLERFAAGPETLDWDAQPNPFREFSGAEKVLLPLSAESFSTSFGALYETNSVPPAPLTRESVGALLQLSMGLSAWKEFGPDRWALRCNPSSGNLHPTEAYVLARGIGGIADGLHHYLSRDHSLERRASLDASTQTGEPRLWLGLSSIHWREAWKYGERGYRYCQLDLGHAIGALRYAAAVLGWKLTMREGLSSQEAATLLGLDRAADFAGGAEKEAPDIVLKVEIGPQVTSLSQTDYGFSAESLAQWSGSANILDRRPMYKWPVIEEASAAALKTAHVAEPTYRANHPGIGAGSPENATGVIFGRRSAQAFDRKARMGSGAFYHLIDRLLARPVPPWDVWTYAPRLHPVFFVHRVDGLEPGVYILVRHPDAEMRLRQAMRKEFLWQRPEHVPEQLNFYRLFAGDCTKFSRTLHCHQAIGNDACFALGMLAEFEPLVRAEPWRYNQLHWEAGLIGQVLYLEAETLGFRGTGIGCYFDDTFHEILGLTDASFASLYHFTVGVALTDTRITTLPPYANRSETTATPAGSETGVPRMSEEPAFERVNVDFARDLINNAEPLILDTRDIGSYENGHIDGAEFVNDSNIGNFLMSTPKDKPVLIYCYHGNASQVRAQTFTDFRFKKVYSLDGGFEGWVKAQR